MLLKIYAQDKDMFTVLRNS